MTTKSKLNIKKIAQLAGVSKATVSRVLNNYPYISAELRDKVMDVIHETGYERNPVARMLASSRSNMLGLIIPTGTKFVFSDPYFPKLTEAISRAANYHRQTLSLFLFNSEEEGVATVKNSIANGMFDGFLITGDRIDDQFLSVLMQSNIRFVLMGRSIQDALIHYVDADNYAGGRLATQYLLERGYRRVAMISYEHNIAAVDRYNGYRDVLEECGIPYDPSLVAYGDFSMDSGTRAMKQLLPHKPDAVFVASDTMALGALRALREQGVRVPDDMGVIGFDDLPPAIQADPPLTTIRQPIDAQGMKAVEIMLSLMEQPNLPPQQIQLPVELVIRASTK